MVDDFALVATSLCNCELKEYSGIVFSTTSICRKLPICEANICMVVSVGIFILIMYASDRLASDYSGLSLQVLINNLSYTLNGQEKILIVHAGA